MSEEEIKYSINKYIIIIDDLYPTDSAFSETNEIGYELLFKAIKNTKFDWRKFPSPILKEYAKLCVSEEKNPSVIAIDELKNEIRKLIDAIHGAISTDMGRYFDVEYEAWEKINIISNEIDCKLKVKE